MSKKMQQAVRYLINIREQEHMLCNLAEQDRELYVAKLLKVYAGISEKEVRGMKIADIKSMELHPTLKRVIGGYTLGRNDEDYLLISRVSSKMPMSDMEYEMRKALARS